MDSSLKQSEKFRAHLKCKNSATNTEPARCGFCGSGIYMRPSTPTNSVRAFCPGSPRCKQRQPLDKCNDNFSVHQPLYQSPPFLHPFFSNFYAPPNANPTPHLSATSSNQFFEQDKLLRRPDSAMNFMLYQNGLMESRQTGEECFRKTENVQLEADKEQRSCSSFPFLSSCECTRAFPWLYSPFIVPLFSYYVFWNSQFSNYRFPFANNPFPPPESEKSTRNHCESPHSRNKSRRKEESGGFWSNGEKSAKTDWKTGRDITGSSTSFVSVISLDYDEETFLNGKKKKDVQTSAAKSEIDNLLLNNKNIAKLNLDKKYLRRKDVSDGEMSPSENQLGKNLCKESYKGKLYVPSSISLSSSDDNENPPYRPTSEPKPCTEKIQNEKRELSTIDIRIDALSEDEYSPSQKLQDKIQAKSLVKPKPRERTTKKCIKNFTMADENVQYQFQKAGDENASMAAAGDLGENLGDGYKANASPVKKSQEKLGSPNEGDNSKDEDTTASEQTTEATFENGKINSPTEEDIRKISRSNTRSWSSGKSRIAKLTPNFRSKERGGAVTPQAGRKSDSEPTEGPAVVAAVATTKKHNCLSIESPTETSETSIKIQKVGNCCEDVQNQCGGANKKNSKSKAKNKSNRKEGKKSKSKF